jgi:nucleoside-diphosphate-sugar epimerase
MKAPQKTLVTGGGGFLGKAIVKRLTERGENVSSFSRGFYSELESMGVVQIKGDISDKEAVEKACKGVDVVFHTAAKPGVWGDYSQYHNTNFIGTQNVISACIKHNVPRLVHTSSPGVIFNGHDMEGVDERFPYPDKFPTPYTKTKALAEKSVVSASKKGLKTIIIRPHLIWGPEDNHLIPRIIKRAKQLVKVGRKDNLVDTVYIDNAASAHILAADKLDQNKDLSGNIYFISQDQPIAMWDMINNILKAAGLDPITRTMPHGFVWLVGAILEVTYKSLKLKSEPKMTRFVADELATAHWFDISAAKKDLGYFPEVSTKEGLSRLEKWLREKSLKFEV